MSRFELNQAPLDGIENGVHFLPCLISQSGPFNPEYFKPQNGEVVLHGRKITETKLELPQNLLVYEKKGNTLQIVHQTNQVSYWTYDVLEPPKNKQQLFDFHKVLNCIHDY
ncbi:hypothetical protein pb186bvf_008172 [Paramecium bursaria]